MQMVSPLLQNLCAVKWSNYILDGVALLLILGFAIVCARRGFVECFFSFITVTVAVILAVSLAKGLLSITGGLFGMQDALTKSFTGKFEKVEGFTAVVSGDGGLEAALQEQNMPGILVNLAVKWFGSGESLPEDTTIAMILGEVSARLLSLLISGVVIFLVSFICLFLLKKILSALINSISLLGFVNALLGVCVGIIESLLIIYAVLAVVTLIPSAAIEGYLSNSLFLGILYENNLLIKCFGLMI